MNHSRRLVLFFIAIVAVSAKAQNGPYQFHAMTPCRVVDTRNAPDTNGGPIMTEDSTRDFRIRGNCGIPSTAKAVSMNLAVTQATATSFLSVWPSGVARPNAANINFNPSQPALSNGAIVALSTNTNDLSVYNRWGSVHVIIDVTGYFQ
ncbi:MAG TPA: hypothetical protein VKB93_07705 [Thermoanaerobaculia bacterium]|nr:hypothetical protein [Thermoanaerobaculia bacterium]